jgi:hypothetical protein
MESWLQTDLLLSQTKHLQDQLLQYYRLYYSPTLKLWAGDAEVTARLFQSSDPRVFNDITQPLVSQQQAKIIMETS